MRKLIVFVFLFAGCQSQMVTEADKAVVVRAEDLAKFGIELPAEFRNYETLKRMRWIDGSVTVEYEFNPPAELDLPYIYSTADRYSPQSESCRFFNAANFGMRLGALDHVEMGDLFTYGIKSRFWILEKKGKPIGNFFNTCTKKNALVVTFSGLYFEEREPWEELISPILSALESMH